MKKEQINIRVSEQLKTALKANSDKYNMNLSEYLVFVGKNYLAPEVVVKNYLETLLSKYALERFNLKDAYSSAQLTQKMNVISDLLQQL